MKKILTFCFLGLFIQLNAATYRNYIGHTVSGNVYTIWINSDTAFGESADAEISYTPSGGGTAYTGFFVGTFDATSVSGANWKVEITLPAGAADLMFQLANTNQSATRYGFTGFSALNNVLPIELTTFTAKNNQNQVNLAWETASELNNDRFEIERSATGRDWKTIATQKSQNADSNVPQNYAFEDKNPLRGTNYYRLRQVDFNGTASYSKVLMVDFGKTSTSVVAFPNPVSANQVTLTFEEDKADASIRIFDNQGRLVRQMNADIQENQQMLLDLSDLPSGILYLQVGEGDITRLVRD